MSEVALAAAGRLSTRRGSPKGADLVVCLHGKATRWRITPCLGNQWQVIAPSWLVVMSGTLNEALRYLEGRTDEELMG